MSRKNLGVFLVFLVLFLVWTQRAVLWDFVVRPSPKHREPLTVGTNVWPGYEPFYLARDRGLYDARSIRLVEYSSATQVIRALHNELIDVGALTLDEALLLRQHGVPIRVILVTDVSHGADVILAKPGIKNLLDLRGRRVGVESSALGAYMLTRALQSVGLTPSDVVVRPVEVDGHRSAYLADDVDAVVTFEPVRSQLLKEGARVLFDSSEIPSEIVDVLVTRRELLEIKPDQLRALIDGWFEALTFLETQPVEASKTMARRLNLSEEEVLTAYEGLLLPDREENRAMFGDGQGSSSLRDSVTRLSEVMMGEHLLKPGTDLEGLLWPELLN